MYNVTDWGCCPWPSFISHFDFLHGGWNHPTPLPSHGALLELPMPCVSQPTQTHLLEPAFRALYSLVMEYVSGMRLWYRLSSVKPSHEISGFQVLSGWNTGIELLVTVLPTAAERSPDGKWKQTQKVWIHQTPRNDLEKQQVVIFYWISDMPYFSVRLICYNNSHISISVPTCWIWVCVTYNWKKLY